MFEGIFELNQAFELVQNILVKCKGNKSSKRKELLKAKCQEAGSWHNVPKF